MQIQIGKIYKIKKGSEVRCNAFNALKSVGELKIKILRTEPNISYDILSADNQKLDWCFCFRGPDLEETPKTLFNLEIGDEIQNGNGSIFKVLSVLPSDPENLVYVLSMPNDFKKTGNLWAAEELEDEGYTTTTPEPQKQIKEMTVEEVSKLVGCEVKIIGDNK